MKRRTLLYITAGTGVALLLFPFLTVLFVPSAEIEGALARGLKREGYVLRTDDFSKTLPLGLKARNVLVSDGRGALLKQKEAGLTRKLVGFVLTDPGIARHGYPVLQDGRKVGEVTSGTKSPSLGTSIGLAYVPTALAAEGSTFAVEIRGRAAAARVVKTPFYTHP